MDRTPRRRRLSLFRLAALLIAIAGFATSFLSYRDARRATRAQAENNFYRRASGLHVRLWELLGRYEQSLYTLRSAFTLNGGITPTEFAGLAQNLADRNPGIQAFEWIPVVPATARAAMESDLSRRAGHPVVFRNMTPAGNLVSAGARPEYYPIVYVHPSLGNEEALGLDLSTGSTSAELQRARQSHEMVLTRPVALAQEKSSQRGVIMIWPVFRSAPSAAADGAPATEFAGWVQGVFRTQTMLEAIRHQTLGPGNILDVLFIDASETDPAKRVLHYIPINGQPSVDRIPSEEEFSRGLSQQYSFPIGGRTWKIIYRPFPGWLGQQMTGVRWQRSAGILLVTALLVWLCLGLGRRTAVIEREVADRTAELSESRRQLSTLLEALPGLAFRCRYDDQMKVIFASVGAEALTGYPAAEFVAGAVHFRGLIHPDDLNRVREATRASLRNHTDLEIEYRLRARNGTEKWVLSRGRGVYADDGKPLFFEGLAIDVTAAKQAEAAKIAIERRLLETQKLESLGLLAGGIAHDFNNILTGILGNASLARLKLGDSSLVAPNLQKIEIAAVRAAELCQQMLSYSGRSSYVAAPVNLGRLVQETVPLLQIPLEGRARLHVAPGDQPAIAMADAGQLRQVVINLVINAAEAMGQPVGEIHVSVGVRAFPREFLLAARNGEGLAAGDYVFIEVRDNGSGMAPETLARIFDPFFTTRFTGRGLGLAAVRGIVRAHQGAIHVASRPGEGSTFTVLLPPGAAPSAPPPAATATAADPARPWSGQVLVIDDEAPVRDTIAELLRTLGFTVTTAEDGAEGIAQFALNPTGFRFVLLDLTMPNLSGEQTLVTLQGIAPDVRVLLISGYTDNPGAMRLTRSPSVGFLQKPFRPQELQSQLQVLLG